MNDLTILHLSDLHIKEDEDGNYSNTLHDLLADVKKRISYVPDGTLVVAVTGDILDRGNKSGISAAETGGKALTETAKSFFRDLKDALGSKVAGIAIVPGNHDKKMTEESSLLTQASQKFAGSDQTNFNERIYKCFWRCIQNSYDASGYIELVRYIYALFDTHIDEKELNKTYGLLFIPCREKNICFVLLNTAWSCEASKTDERHISVGDFQREYITKKYTTGKRKKCPALTICLGHHPLSMLDGREETDTLEMLTSHNEIVANAYLCGHKHDREQENRSNGSQSPYTFSTFMTGLGPEPEGKNKENRNRKRLYALYTFNLDLESIDIYSYGTTANGSFDVDFDLYAGQPERNANKLVYPLKTGNSAMYLKLNQAFKEKDSESGKTVFRQSFKALYPHESVREDFKFFEQAIGKFRKEMCDQLWILKGSFSEGIKFSDVNSGKPPSDSEQIMADVDEFQSYFYKLEDFDDKQLSDIHKLLNNYSDVCNDIFYKYLQQICEKMKECLIPEDDNNLVRFHFRYLSDFRASQYSQLCISVPENIQDKTSLYMKPMGYTDLLEAADKTKRSLIYTLNKSLVKRPPNKRWSNFITCVPLFSGSRYITQNRQSDFPFLTFGLSIADSKMNPLLYYLQMYEIQNTLGDVIEDFRNVFPIDMKEFNKWAKRNVEP